MRHIETSERVGGVDVHVCSFEAAVESLTGCRDAPAGSVRLVNAWCVVVAQDDQDYRTVVNGPGLTLPDGAPVLWALKRTPTGRQAQRVRGPSLFEATLDRGRTDGLRHFFLGGPPQSLDTLVTKIGLRYPGVEIAGQWSPPFGDMAGAVLDEINERITSAAPDIVWVGLGAPKQDMVAANIFERTGLTSVGVGAAFDFVAGTVREAPRWMQRLGLEWLFRFGTEPRRLWRRYLVGNLRFLWILARG